MAAAGAAPSDTVPLLPGGRRVLGHALEFRRDPLRLFQRARAHGEVVRIRFGPFPVYLLNSPDAIRQALVGQARKLNKGISFGRTKRLIGNGLVMSDGDEHRRQRRLMQPAFHRAEIARYTGTMREVAVPRIDGWADGGTLAFDREMRSITLTVLTRALLSSDIGADAIGEIERLLRVLLAELLPDGIVANIPALAWVPTRSNRRFGAAVRRLDTMLTGIIEDYRSAGQAGEAGEAGPDRGDLMSIMIGARDDETGTAMTSRQLRDEAVTLVIAGSETTGNTLAWACYLLSQHPQVQERLQQEADQVLAGRDAGYEDLDRLPFTRAVITETLRLYSPVWVLPRAAAADVELGGYQLPAKSRILFSPFALNRDPALHRDPERFDPGRWATDYTRTGLRASFFPFGQGIRNCIGEGFAWTEAILLLSAIAARWQLRLAPGADVHPVVSSTLVPNELPIIVTRRVAGLAAPQEEKIVERRILGATGISVSELALGATMFGAGGNPDHDDSIRVIRAALDAGINLVDTADVYSHGESETIVGRAIKGRRDEVVLATKFCLPMGEDSNRSGGSRRWITRAVEDSLRRLDTDHIDLYQMHRPDPATRSRNRCQLSATSSTRARYGRSDPRRSRPSRSPRPSGRRSAAATSGSPPSSPATRSSTGSTRRPCCRPPGATAWGC